MKNTVVAERYAEALFELAQEENGVDACGETLREILETVQAYPDLQQLLEHPVVKHKDKQAILEGVFKGKVPDRLLNFLHLLVDKKRERDLPQIVAEYERLRNQLHQTVVAEVTTAVPMYKKTQSTLQKQLEDYLGQKVVMACEVDQFLLGGVTIKIGDRLIDASLHTQLRELAQSLM